MVTTGCFIDRRVNRMSSQNGSSPTSRVTVDGWSINLLTEPQAIDEIVEAAVRRESFAAFTLNLDHLVKLRRDEKFRAAYAAARFVTADGAPVARLASRHGSKVDRVTGADLVMPLCKAAAARKLPVFLFGTSPQALRRAEGVIAMETGYELEVVGAEAPALGFDPEGADADRALERISKSGARLCFIALGAPKQELFAARAVRQGVPVGFACIGAALDFLAGTQVRAPVMIQNRGMEWLWRLGTNPRRLAGRYMSCALVLAELELRSRFSPGQQRN